MEIRFEYSDVFDMEMASVTGKAIDGNLFPQAEAFARLLNQQWPIHGRPLLQKAKDVSGLGFKQKEARCTLTVSDFVSISSPLVVNVKKYLNNSDSALVYETIFHEMLHVLLTDNWQVWPTPLIAKHSRDDWNISAHLHLMSLQRAVHESLGHSDRLDQITEWYKKIGSGYDTTWEIVSEDGLYLAFIEELKDKKLWALRA